MPRFDGTGPRGMGPGTGRGMGPCGFGLRRFYTKREESEMLAEEMENLEAELKAIKERLAEIKERK